MAAGYEVTLGELAAAAAKFTQEGNEMSAAATGLPHSGPDTGDGALNSTLNALLSATQFLADALAGRVTAHGGKLTAAHDNYRKTDIDNQQLYDRLMRM